MTVLQVDASAGSPDGCRSGVAPGPTDAGRMVREPVRRRRHWRWTCRRHRDVTRAAWSGRDRGRGPGTKSRDDRSGATELAAVTGSDRSRTDGSRPTGRGRGGGRPVQDGGRGTGGPGRPPEVQTWWYTRGRQVRGGRSGTAGPRMTDPGTAVGDRTGRHSGDGRFGMTGLERTVRKHAPGALMPTGRLRLGHPAASPGPWWRAQAASTRTALARTALSQTRPLRAVA
jgi:hypothetical protein